MRKIACDGCGLEAEFASGHDIRRSSFHDGEREMTADLCGAESCRGGIIKTFGHRVEITLPDYVLPAFEGTVPGKSMQDLAAERLAAAKRPAT